ncbi:hypothetical protein DD873_14430 [Staphylococcus pseudintermedius]|nr:hypothetical protein DD873_14430 [Staphylococcus pseudintermedius]
MKGICCGDQVLRDNLINDILEKVIKPTSIVAYGEYEDYIHLKKFAQRRISNSLLLLRCN